MGAYHLRAAPGAASFRRAWDAALDAGIAGLRSIAFDRAINGTPETRLYHGKPCVETVRYDNQLLSMILRQYDKGAGQGRREASAFAEQIEPTDVAERMWHWALRDSGKHKMRVFVERIRVQVAQHFQKALTSNPDTLDGIVASFDYNLRQAIENRAQNERRANGGPETRRENARHCTGTVSWKPLDATSFARSQAVRTRLRREAGDE
ncbi:hypothetical protein KX816_14380 [Sphingosinicellaceae bacterium]|nr:hypothetical protein KX816_14380 [Sphingosinicellaceae bacterium]